MAHSGFSWRLFLCGCLALMAAIAWWRNPNAPLAAGPSAQTPEQKSPGERLSGSYASTTARFGVDSSMAAVHAAEPVLSTRGADRSPLADKLHEPDAEPHQDVEVVFTLFEHYRERFGSLPTAEDNAQVVNALTGNNPQRIAILPPDHAAINENGELVDRWGKPFSFHFVSRDHLEIRSAGPDGEIFTQDDLIKASPALKAPPADSEPEE